MSVQLIVGSLANHLWGFYRQHVDGWQTPHVGKCILNEVSTKRNLIIGDEKAGADNCCREVRHSI